jgi:hypothetical protein
MTAIDSLPPFELTDDCHDTPTAGEEDEDSGLIRSYSYTPSPRFRGTGKLFFGFEWEIEKTGSVSCSDMASRLQGLNLPIYFKEDGSLTSGFEVVSHPLSFAWIVEHKEALTKMLSTASAGRFEADAPGTCGLHVHISKAALTSLDIYKIQKLVYENPGGMKRLSCRKSYTYARVSNKTKGMAKKAKTGQSLDKYEAVNVRPEKTIEIRIFRGTTMPATFFAVLEFAHAAVCFVKQSGINGITWIEFCKFVNTNKKTYAELLANLMERGVYKCA